MPSKKTEKTVKPVKATKKATKTAVVESVIAVPKEKAVKKGSLATDVIDTKGKVVASITLPENIFGAKVNKSLMAQAIRVYLANQRRGTAATKSRGEVQGSSKKIYRQKGTGNARHGSKRAPIFVHGGVALGPNPKDYSLKFSKKMKKAALFSALTVRQQDGIVKVVDGFEKVSAKTKDMATALKALGVSPKMNNVLVITSEKVSNLDRSTGNIQGVYVRMAEHLNTHDVLGTKLLLFTKDSIGALEKHFIKES